MIPRFMMWLGLHVHDWSQWRESGEISSVIHKGIVGTVQSRTCKECGKKQSYNIWLG